MASPLITFDGLGTQVKFKESVDDKGELLFTTAFGISEAQNILETAGTYGGQIQGDNIGIASPNMLSLGEVTGSVTYDITINQADKLKEWLKNRNDTRIIEAKTGDMGSAKLLYGDCYFQSITMNASENSIVSADVDFWIYKKALTEGSIGGAISKYGLRGQDNNGNPISDPESFKFTDDEKNVIPYWKTKLDGFPLNIIAWNISITQTLTKKFYCDGLTDEKSPLPRAVFVGPLNVEFGVTVLLNNDVVDLSTLTGDLDLTLKLGSVDFINVKKVKLLSVSPDLTATGMRTIDLSYKAFKMINPVGELKPKT